MQSLLSSNTFYYDNNLLYSAYNDVEGRMQIPNVIGNYVIGETIGEGNYAEVKIATHRLLKRKVCNRTMFGLCLRYWLDSYL